MRPRAARRTSTELNQRIMTEIQLDGRVFFSNAILDDRFVLRTCIVNFRTEAEDMDAVLERGGRARGALDAEAHRPSELRG